ncbi:hypothetical protein [Shewanella sp.]|uniref:hypothetical protein n=1 Tax=Shewanella sp. TaxID=50422 RepID=UPI000EE1F351|nr:hypothetical protein [Shewanella sp.]HCD13673.1 hypothetical protein [Shewanella sp.]
MQSFKKHTLIPLDPQDPLSIAQALTQYRHQLQQSTILREGMFDIEFVAVTDSGNRRLQIDDLQDSGLRSLLQEALSLGPDGEVFTLPPLISDECDLYLSEPLLFAIAMQHPHLTPELLATADAMIAFARWHNDVYNMWLDETRIFGVEALFLLARRAPEQAWRLAHFLVANWDNEDSNGYEQFMARLLNLNGWSEEMLRAFVWCDSDRLRQGFFYSDETGIQSHQALADFLKQNPQRYLQFKQLLSERLLSCPKLLATEWRTTETDDPVQLFFISMFPAAIDWFDVQESEGLETLLQSHFIQARLKDEIDTLRASLERQADGPLACPAEGWQQDADDNEDYRPGQMLRQFKPLVLAQPQGEALWQYLQDGSHPQALEAQRPLEILAASQAHAPLLHQHIVDYCVWVESNQQIIHDFWLLTYEMANELLDSDDEDAADFADILPSATPQQRQQQYLRWLDIWFTWLGKPELEDIREQVVDKLQLLDQQQYLQRFGNHS